MSVIYDLTYENSYYSQNNNRLDPKGTCATTSMIQCLDLCGYSNLFPEGEYSQAEDNLTHFIRTNPSVLEFYKKTDPYSYNEWKLNPTGKSVYQPNEIHSVLNFGTNLWLGREVTKFITNFSINDIPQQIITNKKPLVMSGKFGNLNHVVSCVGVIIKKESESKDPKNLGFFDCEKFLFNDSYGYTWDYTSNIKGEKVEFTPNQVIQSFKNLNNPTEKWVHIFY